MTDTPTTPSQAGEADRAVVEPPSQRVEISKYIRVLWGAKPDGLDWVGWAVWDDYAEECPVYRTKEQAVAAANVLAKEYADGDRE